LKETRTNVRTSGALAGQTPHPQGDSGLGWDWKYRGAATIAARWSPDTLTAIMSRDELAEMNAGIESSGDEIQGTVVGRDVQHDIGLLAREGFELRGEHHPGGDARRHQADRSRGPPAKPDDLIQHRLDIAERRAQPGDQLLPGIRRRDASSGSREQTHADALLEPPNRVTERRPRQPQP
jgi:hypothetical protein